MLDELVKGFWNFDLEDGDKILRIESDMLELKPLMATLKKEGFDCEELMD